MTHRASLGGIQERMAEVRDLGVNLGCDGAEGASRVINSLLCLNTIKNYQYFLVMDGAYSKWPPEHAVKHILFEGSIFRKFQK